MMRQPKGKMVSYYINILLEAANITDIYQLTPDQPHARMTLKQELIKLEATSMQEIQEEVNKWETRMNTASRMLTKKQHRV